MRTKVYVSRRLKSDKPNETQPPISAISLTHT